MLVCELIAHLQSLPQNKLVWCQVVPESPPGAWNMLFDFHDVPNSPTVQLRVFHPQLKSLPDFPVGAQGDRT